MRGGDLLDGLTATAGGRRLLALLLDPRAERARSSSPHAGPVPGVAITGDALPELRDGRVPGVVDLVVDDPGADLGRELQRRVRGMLLHRSVQGATGLRLVDPPRVDARVVPAVPDPAAGVRADPVLTVLTARLRPDGAVEDPHGDLAARRVRLADAAVLDRRPEAVLDVARLAVRPAWAVAPETLAAVRRARVEGAPATARPAHLGLPLVGLLAGPPAETVRALEWLRGLAPDVPLGPGVTVDGPALLAALRAPHPDVDAVLRAMSPTATAGRRRAFAAAAFLRLGPPDDDVWVVPG